MSVLQSQLFIQELTPYPQVLDSLSSSCSWRFCVALSLSRFPFMDGAQVTTRNSQTFLLQQCQRRETAIPNSTWKSCEQITLALIGSYAYSQTTKVRGVYFYIFIGQDWATGSPWIKVKGWSEVSFLNLVTNRTESKKEPEENWVVDVW